MGKRLSQVQYFVALGVASASVMVSLPSFAQAPHSQLLQNKESTEAPSTLEAPASEADPVDATEVVPSSEAPVSPEAPASEAESLDGTGATPSTDTAFSSEELEQFAKVIPELQTIQESAQAEVITAVEASGLSAERFNQIAQAQTSPESAGEVEISSEEQAAFEAVFSEIQQIEQAFIAQREELLQAQGLTTERYQEILAAVQQDPALLQQVEEML